MITEGNPTSLELDQIFNLFHRLVLRTNTHERVTEEWDKGPQLYGQIFEDTQTSKIRQTIRGSLAPLSADTASVAMAQLETFFRTGNVLDVHSRQT